MRKLTLLVGAFLLIPNISLAASLEDLLVQKGVITKSEARASGGDSGANVHWNKGTRIDFADEGFTAKISTQFRTRYEFVDNDDDTATPNESSFGINNARLVVSGSALSEEFDYKVQVDFAGGGAALKDAYLTWNACDYSSLQMGQYKPVFSRGNYTSVSKLQFADRSVASEFFSFDRNQGLQANYNLSDDVTVSAAIFNGNSDGEGINSKGMDTSHLGVVGVRGNIMGEMDPFSEGDVEDTQDLAVNAGVAVAFASNDTEALGDSTDEFGVSGDINVKQGGFSLHGEYYYLNHDPMVGDDHEGTGFYVQTGYFFDPKRWEGAVRYSYIDCDNGTAVGNDIEGNLCAGLEQINAVDATINYYFWQHHLKAQFGYAFLNEDSDDSLADDDSNTNRWIFQLSSWF